MNVAKEQANMLKKSINSAIAKEYFCNASTFPLVRPGGFRLFCFHAAEIK